LLLEEESWRVGGEERASMDSTVTADRRVSDEPDDEGADDDRMTPRKADRDDDGWKADTPTEPDAEASRAKRQRRFMVNRFLRLWLWSAAAEKNILWGRNELLATGWVRR
jgi:hypothetical protein